MEEQVEAGPGGGPGPGHTVAVAHAHVRWWDAPCLPELHRELDERLQHHRPLRVGGHARLPLDHKRARFKASQVSPENTEHLDRLQTTEEQVLSSPKIHVSHTQKTLNPQRSSTLSKDASQITTRRGKMA